MDIEHKYFELWRNFLQDIGYIRLMWYLVQYHKHKTNMKYFLLHWYIDWLDKVDKVLHHLRTSLLDKVHTLILLHQVEILVHKEYIDKHLFLRHYLVGIVDIAHHPERTFLVYNPDK